MPNINHLDASALNANGGAFEGLSRVLSSIVDRMARSSDRKGEIAYEDSRARYRERKADEGDAKAEKRATAARALQLALAGVDPNDPNGETVVAGQVRDKLAAEKDAAGARADYFKDGRKIQSIRAVSEALGKINSGLGIGAKTGKDATAKAPALENFGTKDEPDMRMWDPVKEKWVHPPMEDGDLDPASDPAPAPAATPEAPGAPGFWDMRRSGAPGVNTLGDLTGLRWFGDGQNQPAPPSNAMQALAQATGAKVTTGAEALAPAPAPAANQARAALEAGLTGQTPAAPVQGGPVQAPPVAGSQAWTGTPPEVTARIEPLVAQAAQAWGVTPERAREILAKRAMAGLTR